MADLAKLIRSDLLGHILHVVLVEKGTWTAEALAERTGSPYPTVTKEVRRMQRAGIVTVTVNGRTKHITANGADPAVRPLARAIALGLAPGGGDDMSKKKDKKKDGKKKKK